MGVSIFFCGGARKPSAMGCPRRVRRRRWGAHEVPLPVQQPRPRASLTDGVPGGGSHKLPSSQPKIFPAFELDTPPPLGKRRPGSADRRAAVLQAVQCSPRICTLVQTWGGSSPHMYKESPSHMNPPRGFDFPPKCKPPLPGIGFSKGVIQGNTKQFG